MTTTTLINAALITSTQPDQFWSVSLSTSPIIILLGAAIVLLFGVPRLPKFLKNLKTHTAELNISLGAIGNITIKCNYEVRQIAHHAWTELVSRKAGLPIDPDHDVILEIYDSWYSLFAEIRRLIKSIPAAEIEEENTQKLIEMLVNSLNNGLRPHLTKWQAKFRRWYTAELTKEVDASIPPQVIQKRFPQYQELMNDLIRINDQLVEYKNQLAKIK